MAGKDDDKSTDDMKKVLEQMGNLTKVVGTLATGLESTQKNVTDLTANIGSLSNMNKEQLEEQKRIAAAAKDDDMADELGANDLEGMDRSEFMNHILGQVNKGFDTLSEQIKGQVDSVQSNVDNGNLKSEFNSVRKANPDFDHYKDEIGIIAKSNPEMKIQDMYTLAKANNPEKVVEVTKTLEAEKLVNDKAAAEEAAKDKPKSYGGLTPTSGQRLEKPSDMSQDNAANAAWDETMANIETAEQ